MTSKLDATILQHEIFRELNFRQLSCAIVGNAGHLSLSNYGKEIDAHDVVVRLNQAPTKGYEDKVGAPPFCCKRASVGTETAERKSHP
eukprot:1190886-Prorocentrum_minimum.AAC.3